MYHFKPGTAEREDYKVYLPVPACHLIPRKRPLNTLLSRPTGLYPPPSPPYYASCWTDGICSGGPHPRTLLADLRPRYSIAAPVRACRLLVDNQEGRHARVLEQLIYFQYRSFRPRSLRLFKLGVPEHW